MVEIDKNYAEFVVKPMGAIDLGLERLVKVPGIVEAGAVVCDCQLLDLLDGPGVLDRDSGVVAKSMQKEHLVIREALHCAVDELNDAEYTMFGLEGYADDRSRLPLCHFVDALGKAGIVVDVGNQ